MFHNLSKILVALSLLTFSHRLGAQSSYMGGGNIYTFGIISSKSIVNLNQATTPSVVPNIITDRENYPNSLFIFDEESSSEAMSQNKQFIDGYARYEGEYSFLFPLGNDTALGPCQVNPLGNYSTIDAAFFSTSPDNPEAINTFWNNPYWVTDEMYISEVDSVGYTICNQFFWRIQFNNPAEITLAWNESNNLSSLGSVIDLGLLRIAAWKDDHWVILPSQYDSISLYGDPSDELVGSITTTTAVQDNIYQYYTLAIAQPTPLNLSSLILNGEHRDGANYITWKSIVPKSNNFFEIQRSSNGKTFELIGTMHIDVDAYQEIHFTDFKPLNSSEYYRIKSIYSDNQMEEYSNIIHIASKNNEFVAHPNPTTGIISISGISNNEIIQIFDLEGKLLFQTIGGIIDLTAYPDGTYFYSFSNNSNRRGIIIKKS